MISDIYVDLISLLTRIKYKIYLSGSWGPKVNQHAIFCRREVSKQNCDRAHLYANCRFFGISVMPEPFGASISHLPVH